MLMNLSFNGQLRTESDQTIISNLLRKGWAENNPPEHDQNTQTANFVDGQWIISTNLPEIPNEIPLWAFRSILTLLGYSQNVADLIDSLPEPQKTVAKIQYEYGNFIVRGHPLIATLGLQLGLNKDDYSFNGAIEILEDAYAHKLEINLLGKMSGKEKF